MSISTKSLEIKKGEWTPIKSGGTKLMVSIEYGNTIKYRFGNSSKNGMLLYDTLLTDSDIEVISVYGNATLLVTNDLPPEVNPKDKPIVTMTNNGLINNQIELVFSFKNTETLTEPLKVYLSYTYNEPEDSNLIVEVPFVIINDFTTDFKLFIERTNVPINKPTSIFINIENIDNSDVTFNSTAMEIDITNNTEVPQDLNVEVIPLVTTAGKAEEYSFKVSVTTVDNSPLLNNNIIFNLSYDGINNLDSYVNLLYNVQIDHVHSTLDSIYTLKRTNKESYKERTFDVIFSSTYNVNIPNNKITLTIPQELNGDGFIIE